MTTKAEEGKEVAVKAIMNGDYEFAADVMVEVETQKLVDQGFTYEEAICLLCKRLEKEGYNIEDSTG